jgi:outer membrane protein TolC
MNGRPNNNKSIVNARTTDDAKPDFAMKRSLMILTALFAPAVAFSQEGPRPISLPEAIELAKKNSPQMISARGALRTGAASLRQAKWAFSPLNNLLLGYSSSTSGGASIDSEGFVRQRPAGDWSFSQSPMGRPRGRSAPSSRRRLD